MLYAAVCCTPGVRQRLGLSHVVRQVYVARCIADAGTAGVPTCCRALPSRQLCDCFYDAIRAPLFGRSADIESLFIIGDQASTT
jgi:hypothetical protein